MTQDQGEEESDQQENGDEWSGPGNGGCGARRPFRGQKADQQRGVHQYTLAHPESLPFPPGGAHTGPDDGIAAIRRLIALPRNLPVTRVRILQESV